MTVARGLTLLELLVTISIVVIVAGLGVPAFGNLVRDQRRTAALNALVHAAHYSRSEAIKRARIVTLCKTIDGQDCHTGEAPWNAGWLVFANLDGDQPPRVDPGEQVLLSRPPLDRASLDGNRGYFSFRPFGKRATNGTLVYCDDRGGASARALIISYTGRPRVSRRSPSGGVLKCP